MAHIDFKNREREPVGTIGNEIKNLKQWKVDRAVTKQNLKTKPFEHQKRALLLGLMEDTFLFFVDMGLGKTKIALDIITCRRRMNKGGRALVICPPIVMTQWIKEVEKHSDLSLTAITHSDAQTKLKMFKEADTDIVVISHSWLIRLFSDADKSTYKDRLLRATLKQFDYLIVDEAHSIKNAKSKGFQGYAKYLMKIPYRYLLTGTPVSNDATGMWALYYLLDKGKTFGKNYYAFLNKYFNKKRVRNRFDIYYLKEKMREELYSKFWKKAVRWEESECNDLPDKFYVDVPLELSDDQKKKYKEILKDVKKKGEEHSSLELLGYEYKLMEATAGIGCLDSYKLLALDSIIQNVIIDHKKQLLIWCWLTSENAFLLDHIQRAFPKIKLESIRGEKGFVQKNKALKRWRQGQIDCIVANQSALGQGVDLVEAHSCVYFSNPRSLTLRQQSEKRIHRTGQTKICTYYDLYCKGTIDEINLDILRRASTDFGELSQDDTSKNVDMNKLLLEHSTEVLG